MLSIIGTTNAVNSYLDTGSSIFSLSGGLHRGTTAGSYYQSTYATSPGGCHALSTQTTLNDCATRYASAMPPSPNSSSLSPAETYGRLPPASAFSSGHAHFTGQHAHLPSHSSSLQQQHHVLDHESTRAPPVPAPHVAEHAQNHAHSSDAEMQRRGNDMLNLFMANSSGLQGYETSYVTEAMNQHTAYQPLIGEVSSI